MEGPKNLSQYRLTNRLDWIDRFITKLGCQGVCDYENKVYAALKQLGKGRHYDIVRDVPEDMQEFFIKLSCMYIRDVDADLYFEEDFTLIHRNKL